MASSGVRVRSQRNILEAFRIIMVNVISCIRGICMLLVGELWGATVTLAIAEISSMLQMAATLAAPTTGGMATTEVVATLAPIVLRTKSI
jgi:hypothetical protein